MTRGCRFPAFGATTLQFIGGSGPFDLTGYTAISEVRTVPDDVVILDLQPVITTPASGLITLAIFTGAQTSAETAGVYHWDIELITPANETLGRFVAGQFYIVDKITNS